MQATAFNTQGALPQTMGGSPVTSGILPSWGGSPKGNALNNMQSGQIGPQQNGGLPSGLTYQSGPKISGFLDTKQPMKSQTLTDSSGGQHTVTYHAPDTTQNSPTNPGIINNNNRDENGVQIYAAGDPRNPAGAQITGQTQTPSGATVDATTGGMIAPPPPDNSYSGLISKLAGSVGNNQAIGNQAQQIGQDYGKQIADLNNQQKAVTGYLSTGTTGVAEGGAQALVNSIAAQKANLISGESAALSGLDKQLTAQGQTQSGLYNAGGLAAPQLGQYGQTYYNPQTAGQSSGGSGVQPNDPFYQTMQTYAQLLANNQPGAIPASITGNSVLNAQLQQMAKAINPNYNYNVSQSNAQTQGQQAAQSQTWTSALQQGQNLQSQLTDLIKTFGLNPGDINAVNTGLQKIAQNTSSPQYKALNNYINDIANTYSQILTPAGGTQTDTTRGISASMLDATMSGQGIIDIMKTLDQQAQAKIAGVSTFNQNSGGFSEGQASKDGSLVYKNGQWQVNK